MYSCCSNVQAPNIKLFNATAVEDLGELTMYSIPVYSLC
jgi:hypothetical protein